MLDGAPIVKLNANIYYLKKHIKTMNLQFMKELLKTATELFDRIIDENLLVRRFYLTANHVIREADAPAPPESLLRTLRRCFSSTTAPRLTLVMRVCP